MQNFSSPDVIFLEPSADLKTVLSCFYNNKISHIPIVQEETVIGMVSKTDVVEYLYRVLPKRSGEAFESLVQSIKVKELMVQPLIEADVDQSQQVVLKKLLNHDVSSIVLKRDKKIAGICTEKDMVRYLAHAMDDSMSFSEKLGLHLVDWLEKNGAIRLAKALGDIGI